MEVSYSKDAPVNRHTEMPPETFGEVISAKPWSAGDLVYRYNRRTVNLTTGGWIDDGNSVYGPDSVYVRPIVAGETITIKV